MNEKLKLNSKRGGAAFLVIVIVMLLLIVAVLGGIITYLIKNSQASNNGMANENSNQNIEQMPNDNENLDTTPDVGDTDSSEDTGDKNNSTPTQKPDNDTTQKPEEDKTPDTPARGSKLDFTKDWVYTQYNDAENKLPKLNMYSPYAEKINKEIETKLLQDIKSGNSYGIASYQWHINNNILSLVVDNKGPNDVHAYYIYNINMDTGDAYTNAELLKLKGLVENDFASKLKNACAARFLEDYGMDSTLELYTSAYKKTLEKTYNKDVKMFLNSSGDLMAVGYVYSIAGPEGHDRLFNITGTNLSYAPWMTYILNQNITSITATKYKDDGPDIIKKVGLDKDQLKDIFSKLVDYKLIKTCLGSGFAGDEILISYSVNNKDYGLKLNRRLYKVGDDKALAIALENSKSEVQGEADETEYYYRFQEYDFTILDKYFE